MIFRWHSYVFWSLGNDHDVKEGLKGVTSHPTKTTITITRLTMYNHIHHHSITVINITIIQRYCSIQ